MQQETSKSQVTAALPVLRYAATAVAAARVALGIAALTWPSVPTRPWVGGAADDLTADVLGRALGARDLALGLGTLAALRPATSRPAASGQATSGPAATPAPGRVGAWYAAGALSDALDLAITAAAWPRLPKVTRWLIAASAGGAAIVSAAGALAAVLE